MTKKIPIRSLSEIHIAARIFLESLGKERIFAFSGELGSGKTTFIQALCEELQVVNVVTSPSFSLVNEYMTRSGRVIYHFDFYRIEKLEEVFDLGYEDYFFSSSYVFIEWAEKVKEILPKGTVYVKIETMDNEERVLWIGNPT